MAMSYFSESAAPKDFRISSTESESHYTKCPLCYTIKKNFYCEECIKAGNFVQSSMPYSDRFAEKQAKLLRMKANRKHVYDRCMTLLQAKSKYDTLQTDVKQCKDKVNLIKLAIEQRKSRIENCNKELSTLKQSNTELSLKLPRYQKRVASLGKHIQVQQTELENKISVFEKHADSLAALRRERIRQLNKYIFPVYMTYDTSDSIEELEFLEVDSMSTSTAAGRATLHVGAGTVPADVRDLDDTYVSRSGALAAGAALAAQLTLLAAWTLDVRLPVPLPVSDFQVVPATARSLARLGVCAGALCVWAVAPALAPGDAEGSVPVPSPSLAALHEIAVAAATDDPALGRVQRCTGWWARGAEWAGELELDDEPPEHLHWPDCEVEEVYSGSPVAPASLVTSAAASIASIWRGWTK